MSIRIPGCGDVDLRSPVNVESVVAHPAFQMLLHKSQLGVARTVFPGATHSRLEHSLGAFARTAEFMVRQERLGLVNAQDVVDVSVYGLIHDIGHPALSHTLEPVLERDHHDIGVRRIKEIGTALEASGTSAEKQIQLLDKKHPLTAVVSDSYLGMEKLDYLWRDAYHVGYGGLPEINAITSNLTIHDGKLLLSKRAYQEGLDLVRFYQKMYERVYLAARSQYASRLMQKLYERMLKTGEIDEASLAEMIDSEFEGRGANSRDPITASLFSQYKTGQLPWTVLTFCEAPYVQSHVRLEKPTQQVVGIPTDDFEAMKKNVAWKQAARFEERIATLVGGKPEDVYVIPAPEARRFGIPMINVIDGITILPLAEVAPEIKSLTEAGKRVTAIRVATNDPAAGKNIFKKSDDIRALLLFP